MSPSRDQGLLVCLEGIDGSGKSSVGAALATKLQEIGVASSFVTRGTKAETSSFASERLRSLERMLWEYPVDVPLSSLGDRHLIHLLGSWFYLFETNVVAPKLVRGEVVVIDTWVHKYITRFREKPGFAAGEVEAIFAAMRPPELTVLLDLPASAALARKAYIKATEANSDTVSDIREGFLKFQDAVRRGLLEVAAAKAWMVVDATESVRQVVDEVAQEVQTRWAR